MESELIEVSNVLTYPCLVPVSATVVAVLLSFQTPVHYTRGGRPMCQSIPQNWPHHLRLSNHRPSYMFKNSPFPFSTISSLAWTFTTELLRTPFAPDASIFLLPAAVQGVVCIIICTKKENISCSISLRITVEYYTLL
jgi:hypothetical protein